MHAEPHYLRIDTRLLSVFTNDVSVDRTRVEMRIQRTRAIVGHGDLYIREIDADSSSHAESLTANQTHRLHTECWEKAILRLFRIVSDLWAVSDL